MTGLGALGRLLRGLAALAALLLLLAGVPAGLWTQVGWPLPAALPTWAELTRALADTTIPDEVLINTLAIASWAAWAVLAASVLVELPAAARGRAAPRLPHAGPFQALAGALVTALLLAVLPAGGPRAQATIARPPLPPPLSAPGRVDRPVSAPPPHTATTAPATAAARRYTVQRRDSLWGIAERQLGDPLRWSELYHLNHGRSQPDGAQLTDPDYIRPGWILSLPAGHPPAAPPRRGPGHTPPADRNGTAGGHPHGAQPPPAVPPAPTAPHDTTRPPTAPAGRRAHPPEVLVLPSGSIIGLSLAAGIAAALTLARLRARVRRTPGTPLPDNGGHGPGDRDTTRRLLGFAAKAGAPDDLDRDANPAHPTPPVAHAPLPAPDPRCPHPGRVVVAERDGKELALDLAGCGAIAITGPAAAGAARAAVVAFLAAGGPAATEVLLIGEELLPGVAEFPGLRRAGDLASGLTALDTELLHRARLLDLEDAPDYTTHRREHPDDPLPALVLAVDAVPPDQAARLLGALIQGPRLGVGALLTNTTPEGAARVTLDGTGRIDAAVPTTLTDQQLTGARMLTLTEPEAAELLDILASSRTDLPLAPDQPAEPTPAAAPPQPPEPAHGARAAAAMLPSDAAPTPAAEPATPLAAAGDATALLRVQLLGAYRIQTAGGEVRTGLRARARELLAYYLLHPNGVSLAAAVEALWPEAAPGQGIDWAWTALGNLRATLRKATGVAELKLIERHGEVYRPNRALLDVDLWRVEAALATAQQAVDAPAVTAALADAVAAYLGALLDGIDYYTWLEIPREDLRRRIVDAAARLAELRDAAGQADGALAALEQAVTFDPYAEELYRRIMRLQAIQGRPDAVRRTYQQLQRHLAELDVEPDQMTEALLTELLERRPPRRGHRSR